MALDLLALVDVESTGLSPTTDEVIELGVILFSLSHNCILQQVSTLVPVSMDVSPTEHINGITARAANDKKAYHYGYGLDFINSILLMADACAAHNASFDKAF
ncbi:MAG: 3'-5' exonuclease, partial [Cyanobacteria bacterium J06642_11]